jgi:FKBP12-rapamycin complex-associated protein
MTQISTCFSRSGLEIEIPGQYNAYRKPLPDHHVMVSSFGESLHVISSKEKPKRICIHGNDAVDYDFLLKVPAMIRQTLNG